MEAIKLEEYEDLILRLQLKMTSGSGVFSPLELARCKQTENLLRVPRKLCHERNPKSGEQRLGYLVLALTAVTGNTQV